MFKKIKKEELLKEMDDVKNLISHLEEDYRKANISEKNYQELKKKYSKKLEELEEKLGMKRGAEDASSDEKSKDILGKFFGKKKVSAEPEPEKTEEKEIEVGEIEEMTPEVIERLAQQVAEQSGVKVSEAEVEEESKKKEEAQTSIEIEKLKVMLETLKEANKVVEESIRNISESIGELRSMVFQVEGSNREIALKFERIEDEIAEVRPKNIEKKFRDVNTNMEKQQILLEKFEKQIQDLSKKINEVYEMLKKVGGIENLVKLDKGIQKKIGEMREALKYTERLALKTESIFIDLNKSLEDLTLYKARQETMEESVKDLLRSIDGLNVRFESIPTKKDLEFVKGDILLIQKQIEEINKVLPIVKTKLPEPIEDLKREREDIALFLSSLDEQLKSGTISVGDYEEVKKKNLQRLADVEKRLEKEWKLVEEIISKGSVAEAKIEKVSEELTEEKPKKVINKEETKDIKPKKKEAEGDKRLEIEKTKESEERAKREEMVDVLKKIKERFK